MNKCQRRLPYTWNPYPRPEEAWVKDEKGTHHPDKKTPTGGQSPWTY